MEGCLDEGPGGRTARAEPDVLELKQLGKKKFSIKENFRCSFFPPDGVPVPVVCVVVEGGPGTLETVMSALQSGTPAVIVEGTGRAADILAYAYWNSHEIEVEVSDHLGEKIKK